MSLSRGVSNTQFNGTVSSTAPGRGHQTLVADPENMSHVEISMRWLLTVSFALMASARPGALTTRSEPQADAADHLRAHYGAHLQTMQQATQIGVKGRFEPLA